MWDRRLRRIDALQELWPFASDVLRFFRTLTEFQRALARELNPEEPFDPRRPRFDALLPWVETLLKQIEAYGPPTLARLARELKGRTDDAWKSDLVQTWKGKEGDPAPEFFSRALLQPFAAGRPERAIGTPKPDDAPTGRCPFCRAHPIVSILRENPESVAAERTLICSICALEWPFPRVICPSCGEEDAKKLSRYTAQEIPWMRVDGCDACRRYLKAVDLTKESRVEAVADEVGSTPLDLIAQERDLTKIQLNIVGM